jgi:hypothetical protein
VDLHFLERRRGVLPKKAVQDLRSRRYAWGITGLASATVFLATPIQTHAVMVDLPVAGQ